MLHMCTLVSFVITLHVYSLFNLSSSANCKNTDRHTALQTLAEIKMLFPSQLARPQTQIPPGTTPHRKRLVANSFDAMKRLSDLRLSLTTVLEAVVNSDGSE